MSTMIGYARVSTAEQNLKMQEDALKRAGCYRIFTDVISGAKDKRPGLDDALAFLREGDNPYIKRLDMFIARRSSVQQASVGGGFAGTGMAGGKSGDDAGGVAGYG